MTEKIIRLLSTKDGTSIPEGWYFKGVLYTEPAIPLFGAPVLTILITDDPNDTVTLSDTSPGIAEYIEAKYGDAAKSSYSNAWGAPAGEFRPEYYQTEAGIEPWDVIKAFRLDYWLGTAVAYLLRAGRKPDNKGDNGTVDDIRKAWTFLGERLRELEKEEHPAHVVRGSDIPIVDTQYADGSPLHKE